MRRDRVRAQGRPRRVDPLHGRAQSVAAIVTHVADARTSVLHPASHTHRQLTDEQLAAAGVAPDLIRLSVGIEDAGDIIADIAQALAAR